jgi:CHASE3 domain sensor protein
MRNLKIAAYSTAVVTVIYCGLNFAIPASARSQIDYLIKTLEVQRMTGECFICMVNCETGYRGYMLTENETFLEPLEECSNHIMPKLKKLQGMISDNDLEKKLLPNMIETAKNKLELSKKVITLKNLTRDDKIIWLSKGKMLMDQFRNQTRELIEEEDRVLDDRKTALTGIRNSVMVMRIMFTIILITLIMWTCFEITSTEAYDMKYMEDRAANKEKK